MGQFRGVGREGFAGAVPAGLRADVVDAVRRAAKRPLSLRKPWPKALLYSWCSTGPDSLGDSRQKTVR